MPRSLRETTLLALAIAVLCAPVAAASQMVPGPPWRPKDFALVKKDGLYHLFYTRRNVIQPFPYSENDLGHATSADLGQWKQYPPVLRALDGDWDGDHIWAPSIVLRDSIYYMFYAGVADSPAVYQLYQRIGVATSTDLMNWNRMDTPVFGCTDVPWAICDSLGSQPFRDPFVMSDPAQPGHWLLYYATAPASDPGGMIVGTAAADSDLTRWSDLGPLWITHRSQTYNSLVESPHLFEHGGLWYLMYTTEAGQPLTFSTGPGPLGDVGAWTYRGRLGTMLGLDTQGWYASETLRDGLVDYFAFAQADRIMLTRIVWDVDWRFQLVEPDPMHVIRMSWDSLTVAEGDSVGLTVISVNGDRQELPLEAWGGAQNEADAVISLEKLNLPDVLTLSGDTTRLVWPAVSLADTSDPARSFRVTLRTKDQTAATGVLTIRAPAPPPDTLPPDPGPPGPPEGWIEDRIRGGGILLGPSPYGDLRSARPLRTQTGLLIEMARAAETRLDLFDLQGRVVRNLLERRLEPGAHVVPWDGRDQHGARRGPGVYFARIVTPEGSRTVRLVLTR